MKSAVQSTSIDAFHNHCLFGKASQQRTRIHELVHETGELEERSKRRDRVSGITIRPVGLPLKQLDLFQ